MDGLERRVEAVEGDIRAIRGDVTALRGDVTKLGLDVAEIKGRLSNMPTTFQVLTWFIGVAMALVALTFTIARIVAS